MLIVTYVAITIITLCNVVNTAKTTFEQVVNRIESFYSHVNNNTFFNLTIPTTHFTAKSVTQKVVVSYDKREFLTEEMYFPICKYTNFSLTFIFDLTITFNNTNQHVLFNKHINNTDNNITIKRSNVIGVLQYSEMNLFEDEGKVYVYQESPNNVNKTYFICDDLQYYTMLDYFDEAIRYDNEFKEKFHQMGENVMKYVVDLYPSEIEEMFLNAIDTVQSFNQFNCCNDAFEYIANIKDIKYESMKKLNSLYSLVNNMSMVLRYSNGITAFQVYVTIDRIIVGKFSIRMDNWNTEHPVVKKIIKEIFIRVMYYKS
jgi:hypothetical protein